MHEPHTFIDLVTADKLNLKMDKLSTFEVVAADRDRIIIES